MKLIQLGIFGIILQSVCLILFILISRTAFADLGKPIVITLSGLSVGFLLWSGVRNASGPTSLCLLPLVFAIGYMVVGYFETGRLNQNPR